MPTGMKNALVKFEQDLKELYLDAQKTKHFLDGFDLVVIQGYDPIQALAYPDPEDLFYEGRELMIIPVRKGRIAKVAYGDEEKCAGRVPLPRVAYVAYAPGQPECSLLTQFG